MTQTTSVGNVAAAVPEFTGPSPSHTPRLLRRLQVIAALVLLVAGGVGTLVISDLRADLASAPGLAEQYARLGQVQNRLVEAANLAATGVIIDEVHGGSRAKAAGEQLAQAAGLLVTAAKERPADAGPLEQISQDVVRYGQLLRGASGTDRPKALAALEGADQLLDGRLLKSLTGLQSQLEQQAKDRSWGENTFISVAVGLAIVAALAWISWALAQRSHRALNIGLVGAAVAAIVVVATTVGAQNAAAAASDLSRDAQFGRVVNITEAAAQVGAARRVQIGAVLERSWGTAAQTSFATAFKAAGQAADTEAGLPNLSVFEQAHAKLAALLAEGDWAGAGKLVADTGDKSLTTMAKGFSDAAAKASTEAVQTAATQPGEVSNSLLWQLGLVLLVAVAGAAVAVLGVAQRLKEYR